ncbi:MAG: type II toxin-antitoxin system RelE/ParE family toxin [Sphingomonadales bacterium]
MSAGYKLTPLADADLAAIYRYTAERWGFFQADAYQAELEEHLSHIVDHPMIGVARDKLLRGLRSHRAGSHVIYYEIVDGWIEVLRVLHGRQDAGLAFNRN